MDAKNHEEKEKEDSSDYEKLLRTKKGKIEAIAKLDHEIIDFEKELKNTRNEFDKKLIQRDIDKLKGTREDIEDLGRKNKGNALMNSKDLSDLNKLVKEMDSLGAKIADPTLRKNKG